MAESPAYRGLSASAKALLLLLQAEVAEQGMIAAIDTDDIGRATGMRRPAISAALAELSTAGFIVASESGGLCVVAASSAWRRT